MVCPYELCNISVDDELCVTCWFCLNQWHVKCARINAKVVDTIRDNVGVRWCCVHCRKLSADFYNFVKDLQSELGSMKKEFTSLSKRFENFSNLFDKYQELDEFVSSPSVSGQKRKRSAKKAPNKVVPSRKPTVSVGNTVPQSPSVNITDTTETDCVQTYASVASHSASEIVKDVNEVINPKSVSISSASLEKTSKPTHGNRESSVQSSNASSVAGTSNSLQPGQRPLSMAPTRKMVFVSRFAPDTSAEDINHYIKSKIDGNFFLRCYKLRSAFSESRSSFKIVVEESMFHRLISREFWPANAFVKEFLERSENLAHLPQRAEILPKN